MPSEFLKDKGIVQGGDYCRIVGLGTDGAAVMTGRHNELGVKLSSLTTSLFKFTVLHTGLILLPLRQVRTLIISNSIKGR